MLLTYIHELGHDIHLKISSLQLKQKYSKSNIIITRKLYIFYSGYTHNTLYKYFEDNKMYNYIRINAISGTLFVTLVFITTGICFDILFNIYYTQYGFRNIEFLYIIRF